MRLFGFFRFALSKGRGTKPAASAQLQDEQGCPWVLNQTANGLVVSSSGDPQSVGEFQNSELANRAFVDRVHLLDRVKYLQALDDACGRTRSQSVEIRFRSKGSENGGWTWLAAHVSPAPAQKGQPALARVRYENIGALKALQDELARTRDALDVANSEHANVISQVGHHIGNSLQVIMGNAELLISSNSSHVSRGHNILEAAQELQYFTEEIRQSNRSSHSLEKPKSEDFNWHEIVDEVISRLSFTAKNREIRLVPDIPSTLPMSNIELVSFRLLVSNLLKEFLAAAPRGSSVAIRARQFGPKVKFEFSLPANYAGDALSKQNFIIGSALKKLSGQLDFKSEEKRHQITLTLPIKSQNLRTPSKSTDATDAKTVDEKGEYRARLSA